MPACLAIAVSAAAAVVAAEPFTEQPGWRAKSNIASPETAPLAAMSRRAVFFDERLDAIWSTNQDRLVRWLVDHGFRPVDGESIAPWMLSRITEGNAYGSVVVLTMGQAPASLAEETGEKILWVRYLKAGGRIVSLGDLPFNYFQYPDPRPLPRALDDSGLAALGLRGGWDQPYWGRDLPVTKTPQATAWGFESVDGSITGFPVESISTAFGTYTLPENGKRGASSWMKNLRADMPWSGLIKMCQRFDGVSDSDLRDVWRAANYVGKPVEIPPLPPPHRPPPAPDITVQLTASGISGRTEFCRGEDVAGVVSVNRFEIGGVPYTWFVNAHTGKEYMFCRERMGAGHPGAGTPEKVAELIAWEKAQTAAGPFCARVAADSLSGVPYDLVLGRPIPVENVDGRPSFTVTMDRFGGSLVAFYPEAIDHVALRLPATARLLEEVAATIEVHGRRTAIPGAVPTEVTLRDPAGKTSVLSGVRATDRGMLVFSWTPAVNDLKGTWTIEAVELASGKTARGSVLIGP
jgi:hypothetical protein